MDEQDKHDAELLQRAKASFEREVAALDGATRARLTQARHAALAQLETPQRAGFANWMPVGAAAAVAVAAVGVALTVRGPDPAAPIANGGDPRAAEMELLLGEDELGLYAEDPEFYAWVAETAAETAAVAGEPDDAG